MKQWMVAVALMVRVKLGVPILFKQKRPDKDRQKPRRKAWVAKPALFCVMERK